MTGGAPSSLHQAMMTVFWRSSPCAPFQGQKAGGQKEEPNCEQSIWCAVLLCPALRRKLANSKRLRCSISASSMMPAASAGSDAAWRRDHEFATNLLFQGYDSAGYIEMRKSMIVQLPQRLSQLMHAQGLEACSLKLWGPVVCGTCNMPITRTRARQRKRLVSISTIQDANL
jgi:hypothetical protein